MDQWHQNLESLRSRELDVAFSGFSLKTFKNALELGAGNGFQSRKILKYAEHLVATELNEGRLKRIPVPGIEYYVCDAERISHYFEPNSFDLVFASNLFEHLPDPMLALDGIRTVLAPGGVVILIMPNTLWKIFSLIGFYPNTIRLVWRAIMLGRLRQLVRKYITHTQLEKGKSTVGNNLKTDLQASVRAGILWPAPHGAYRSNLEELSKFRKGRWLNLFRGAGYKIVTVRKGPISSGYGFGFDTLRFFFEWIGLTTEYIYTLSV